jgi:hypothetical protein
MMRSMVPKEDWWSVESMIPRIMIGSASFTKNRYVL